MKKFSKRFSLLLAFVMLIAMSTAVLTSSAADDAKMVWDFTGTTDDLATWEGEGRLYAYAPWSIGDLEIVSNKLQMFHTVQESGCNSLDLVINDELEPEDLSAYKSIALWIDTTKTNRAFTIKFSIRVGNDFISIYQNAPYNLYYDNGPKQEAVASGDDANWIFLRLPENFKGYIEMPFSSMNVLNWNANNKKNIDANLLKGGFRLILEFNESVEGEISTIDSIQLLKTGAKPIGWVQGAASSSTAPSSTTPSSTTPSQSESSEPVDESSSEDASPAEGSSESVDESAEPSSEESSSTSSSTTSESKESKGLPTVAIVVLIIVGVAVVAGGGFAAYKFVFSKK